MSETFWEPGTAEQSQPEAKQEIPTDGMGITDNVRCGKSRVTRVQTGHKPTSGHFRTKSGLSQ